MILRLLSRLSLPPPPNFIYYWDQSIIYLRRWKRFGLIAMTAKELLNNVHKLQELCQQKHHNFVTAFSSVNDVVLSCYGYDLQPDYKSKIAKFKKDYLQLKISVARKVHAVYYHIEEFCAMTEIELGPFSERQANRCTTNSTNAGKSISSKIRAIHFTKNSCCNP